MLNEVIKLNNAIKLLDKDVLKHMIIVSTIGLGIALRKVLIICAIYEKWGQEIPQAKAGSRASKQAGTRLNHMVNLHHMVKR